jgi:mono/diheme cytochrome c family protein
MVVIPIMFLSEQAFQDLGCHDCHVIGGEASPTTGPDGRVLVVLGGKVAHIESHGELVTSIVNPSHGFSRRYPREQVADEDRSKMPNFNETMTVEELINLTAYLQSKYELELNQIYGP